MDELAPAPTQRTYDDVGRVRDENFRARRKAAKKFPAPPLPEQETGPGVTTESEPEPENTHELDLLA